MGNPHCVIFVDQATDAWVLGLGPQIERDPRFPARVNVEFVEVESRAVVRQRTWERGSGETWACGTGASAVCVAGCAERADRATHPQSSAGWRPGPGVERAGQSRLLTGPAVEVFSGQWPSR